MNNLTTNIGHIATTFVIIVAVTVLAWHGTINGGTAVAIIAGIGGVSVGGGVASSSAGASVPSSVVTATSLGTVGLGATTTTPSATTTPSTTDAVEPAQSL